MDFEKHTIEQDFLSKNDMPSNWKELIMLDAKYGSDPLTPTELRRALKFTEELQPNKTYSNADMKLFYRFVGKFHSLNAKKPFEYQYIRNISDTDYIDAVNLTKTKPLFQDKVQLIQNEVSKLKTGNFENDIKNVGELVFKKFGKTEKPQLVDSSSFNQLQGSTVKTIYRGFKEQYEIDEFLSGEFRISNFWTGNGVYFTDDIDYARCYCPNDNLILTAKINFQEVNHITNKVITEAMHIDTQNNEFGNLFYNVGVYGVLKGFDVVNRIEAGSNTFLILDRSKLIIEK